FLVMLCIDYCLRKAKVITERGEMRASLKEASDVISTSLAALQKIICREKIRHISTFSGSCDTVNNIWSERNSTVIFLLPVEFLKPLFIPDLCAH
ncbi:hypothetical protein ALC60_11546, partial [Trachymyrmex zeteki]